MKSLIFSIFIFLFVRPAFSEFKQQVDEQSVIDPVYSKGIVWEEASFTSQKKQRNIASVKEENTSHEFQWQGNLEVLNEIPYSHPQVSRFWLKKKVLAEMGY